MEEQETKTEELTLSPEARMMHFRREIEDASARWNCAISSRVIVENVGESGSVVQVRAAVPYVVAL